MRRLWVGLTLALFGCPDDSSTSASGHKPGAVTAIPPEGHVGQKTTFTLAATAGAQCKFEFSSELHAGTSSTLFGCSVDVTWNAPGDGVVTATLTGPNDDHTPSTLHYTVSAAGADAGLDAGGDLDAGSDADADASSTAPFWEDAGIGDCSGNDITQTDGSVPSPAQCTDASAGLAAICWDGVTYSNSGAPTSAFCTYKTTTAAACSGGANTGYRYKCVP